MHLCGYCYCLPGLQADKLCQLVAASRHPAFFKKKALTQKEICPCPYFPLAQMKVTVYLKFLFLAILANSNPQCLILPGIIFPLHKRSLIGFYKARPSRVGVCDRTYSKKNTISIFGILFQQDIYWAFFQLSKMASLFMF